jgi:2-keto-4-pentenoate hydratase/2-oxohepta-3-ene-1,7-dioic acid hydratase in catechol pathway
MKLTLPIHPEVFFKPSTCLNAPSSPIHLPPLAVSSADLEVELAVVLGADAKDVSAANAMQYVLGYMTANDVTAREIQGRGSQWGYCKGFDGFAPVGPVLVSRRVLPDPSVLELRSTLNERVMQDGRARNMIFTIAEIVAYLSVVSGCSL